MTTRGMRIAPGSSRTSRSLWWFMVASCIGVSLYSLQYFLRTPNDSHFAPNIAMLRLHILGGVVASLIGPWQFSPRLRANGGPRHRWVGRGYLLAVVVGATAGFALATISREGVLTHVGFGLLAVLWLSTAIFAYRAVRRGRIAAHRKWMTRNFALTLAAVTLRNYLPLFLFGLHWSFRAAYIAVAWLCWVPNLLVAEWIVRRRSNTVPSTAFE